MAKWTVVCLLAVLALAGCGSGESAEMSAAVKAIDPQLRSLYDHSYAGLEVVDDKLIVYRKPNAAVDALVRDLADDADVDVELRDAPYALEQLQPLAERVGRDRHHWRTRNFPVELVVTRPDGTGVNAFVATDDLEAARAEFRDRYGDEPVFVERPSRTGIVPAGDAGPRRPGIRSAKGRAVTGPGGTARRTSDGGGAAYDLVGPVDRSV